MSVSEQIVTTATTMVTGLSLSPTPTVKPRKRRVLVDGESPPVILLGANEVSSERQTAGGVYVERYTLVVCAAQTSAGKASDNTSLRDWADAIEFALSRGENWATAALTVDDVFPGSRVIFDEGAGALKLDWAIIRQTVQVRVQR